MVGHTWQVERALASVLFGMHSRYMHRRHTEHESLFPLRAFTPVATFDERGDGAAAWRACANKSRNCLVFHYVRGRQYLAFRVDAVAPERQERTTTEREQVAGIDGKDALFFLLCSNVVLTFCSYRNCSDIIIDEHTPCGKIRGSLLQTTER